MYVLDFELRECSADQSLAGGQKQTHEEGEILNLDHFQCFNVI